MVPKFVFALWILATAMVFIAEAGTCVWRGRYEPSKWLTLCPSGPDLYEGEKTSCKECKGCEDIQCCKGKRGGDTIIGITENCQLNRNTFQCFFFNSFITGKPCLGIHVN